MKRMKQGKKAGQKAGVGPYPKPGENGGRLIRQVIAFLREQGVSLPLVPHSTSHILIATSAGLDSTALATLIVKYGRRVGGQTAERVSLLHVNHGWRGKESDADAKFVRTLGKKLGVKTQIIKLPKAEIAQGRSWEDEARTARKAVFQRVGKQKSAVILTAHTADDLAETVLWRILTGNAGTHAGAIAVRHGNELRPFLTLRKKELQAFLEEEGQSWREDRTNHEGRFLRSKMRRDLMPSVESLFPRAIEHLRDLALRAQRREVASEIQPNSGPTPELFQAAGLKLRRSQWLEVEKFARSPAAIELHLPQGFRLRREVRRGKPGVRLGDSLRFILEKISPLLDKPTKPRE